MRHVLYVLAIFCVLGCSTNNNSNSEYLLEGVWKLKQRDFPIGRTETLEEKEGTLLRLYDGDSMMYQCWLTRTETGLIISPFEQCPIRLVDNGHGEYVYLEDSNPRPLNVKNDSAIVIQQNGVLNTWFRDDDVAVEWSEEIREIMQTHMQKDDADKRQSYVLSAKERRQNHMIQVLIFSTIAIIVLLMLITRIALDYRKEKRRLQLQLQQIQEVQDKRPQVVRQAIESVESDFFASDEYLTLQHRISTGGILKEEDWQNIENQIKSVYPGFRSQLLGLYPMSELEYQVCLLIKLRIAPSDIAAVLARDASTISTVRSRLYKKVFGQKGGAREWDELILSIGA